jgi:hypothetical protein
LTSIPKVLGSIPITAKRKEGKKGGRKEKREKELKPYLTCNSCFLTLHTLSAFKPPGKLKEQES